MKNFYISFRTLFKKGRHNDIKILSLGVGLAMDWYSLLKSASSCRTIISIPNPTGFCYPGEL